MPHLLKITLLIIILISSQAFSEEAYLIENEISFSNGSTITQVTKNTLIPTPNASPTVPDNASQIMKLHGQLLLHNGLLIDNSFVKAKAFLDSCVGMISAFASTTVPYGWLLCDGETYTTTSNCELQALGDAIRTNWGGTGTYTSGHFVGKFKVPDLRGMFLRGADSMNVDASGQPNGVAPSGTDPEARFVDSTFSVSSTKKVGSYQPDSFIQHGSTHLLSLSTYSTNHTHNIANIPGLFVSHQQDYDADEDEHIAWFRSDENGNPFETDTSSTIHRHIVTLPNNSTLTNTSTTNSDTTSHPKNYAVVYGIRF